MSNRSENQINVMLNERKRRRWQFPLLLCLAILVAVGVAGIFHLPATAKTYQVTRLTCSAVPPTGEACADFFVHIHNDDCYDTHGNLVCPLPEIRPHRHTADCYTTTTELVCTIPESDGHQHTADCYTRVRGELTCELPTEAVLDEEGNVLEEGHVHTDECYAWYDELICGMEEGEGAHHHDDSCYETSTTQTCGMSEILLHTHTDDCYQKNEDGSVYVDENGNRWLVCGQLQVLEHVHGAECFTTYELDDGEPEFVTTEETAQSEEEPAGQTEEEPTAEPAGESQFVFLYDEEAENETDAVTTDTADEAGQTAEATDGSEAETGTQTTEGTENTDTTTETENTDNSTETENTEDADNSNETAGTENTDNTDEENQEAAASGEEAAAAVEEPHTVVYTGTRGAEKNGMTVLAEIPEGALDENAQLILGDADEDAARRQILKAVNENAAEGAEREIASMLLTDIGFAGAGEPAVLNGSDPIRVTLRAAAIRGMSAPKLFHLTGDTVQEIKDVIFDTQAGTAVFTSTTFSPFAIVDLTGDDPAEETAEETVSVSMPAQSFTGETGGVIVSVEAPEGAFPTGTTMVVSQVEMDDDTLSNVTGAVESSGEQKVVSAQAVDISFYDAEQNLIEPLLPIKVSMKSALVDESENVALVHLPETGTTGGVVPEASSAEVVTDVQVVENPDENNEIQFESNAFSVYVLVGTETITTNYITADGETYAITVTYGPEAMIPDGATLTVAEIPQDSEEYAAYLAQAQSAVNANTPAEADTAETEEAEAESETDSAENSSGNADRVAVTTARFFDITILDAEGNPIEPAAPVDVKIEYAEPAETAENYQVLHFGEETEVLNPAVSGEEGTASAFDFQANSFSVFGVVGTKLIKEITLTTPDGEDVTYVVSVTYGPEAMIPEGSTLSVTSIEAGTESYDYARNAVLADKKEKGEFVNIEDFNLAALDISIIDPDGNEIEPSATVKVDIRIKELPGVEDLETIKDSLEIQHHVEVNDGVVVEKVFDGNIEGTFQMETNEKVVEEGTVVDPNTVNEEDFQINEEINDAVDVSFNTEVFSTFTISWNNARGNGVKIHYVDQNGQELQVANSVFPNTIGNTSTPAHLIYDINGYEYDHTYRRYYSSSRWNEQNIVPELQRDSAGWAYRTENGSDWYYLSQSNSNHKDEIYVVYKKKADVTQGGSPTLKPVKPEDYPEEPSILKESVPNGDGTTNLSLSIIGHTTDREVERLADVIVVFDVSGSMNDNLSSNNNTKRLAAAKTAVNNLVDNLASKKNSENKPLVRMALVPFSTTVGTITELTDLTATNTKTFKTTVTGLKVATGNNAGTNWDAALQAANQMAVDPGRATFIVFVTDGDPTFRITRTNINDAGLNGNNYSYVDIREDCYLAYKVFGTGSNDNRENNYDAAVTQGQAIVGAKKNLYTIGISTDVTKVSNFNRDVGGAGAYVAADAAALNKAFSDIEASIIAKLGFSDIQMTDGITEMTQTVEKSGLTTTDGIYTYWKKGKDDSSFSPWVPASEGCQEANYNAESGAVVWNMGPNFMPEDGATYKVTWKAWPSQEAYDILAKCKNTPSFYDTLTAAEKAQITRTGSAPNYTYTLVTNEPGANTTYRSATKSGTGIDTEGESKELIFNTVEPLGLASSQIFMEKIWVNDLDDRTITGSYTFPVKADGVAFGDGVVLSSSQNPKWKNSYNISTGLMTTNPYVVYEHGHDYVIEEPADLSYQWDFKSDVYHPMVIDNQTVNLIKVDKEAESDYTIDGKFYKILTGEAVLRAVNERRSNLNISKTVVDEDGNHFESDQVFTFTVTVDEAHDDEVWLSAYDTIAERTVMDSSIVSGEGVQYQSSDGYFHAPSGTTLTLRLKDGWNYRFTNLSVGSTYSIIENIPVPDGYTFEEAHATVAEGKSETSTPTGTVTDQKTEGTIDKSNSVYTVAYTNKTNTTTLKLRKTDEEGNSLAGADLTIVKDHVGITGSPFTTTQEDIELTLVDGIYTVTETGAPAGYVILNRELYFRVSNGTVTITDKDGNETVYNDFTTATEDGVIVLKLKNHPGVELPATGGPGTALFTAIGGIMTALAGAILTLKKRKAHA